MMEEEYERRQLELARHAESEGAWYYDPDSPTIWKQYIIGPVPLWKRIFWGCFPPSHITMQLILQRRSEQTWAEATARYRSPKVQSRYATRAQGNELEWLDELIREHEAGTRDNSDYIRRLICSIKDEHPPSEVVTAQIARAQRVIDGGA